MIAFHRLALGDLSASSAVLDWFPLVAPVAAIRCRRTFQSASQKPAPPVPATTFHPPASSCAHGYGWDSSNIPRRCSELNDCAIIAASTSATAAITTDGPTIL